MHYLRYPLLSLAKSFIAIIPFFLLSGCRLSEPEINKKDTFHPLWHQFNESETTLPKDKCIVTKMGLGTLRFSVSDHQKYFNSKSYCKKNENRIVETDRKAVYWLLTPNFYGDLTVEKFSKTIQTGMKYKAYNDKQGGIPKSLLEECLALDPIDCKDAILIISTGLDGKLGISESLKQALRDKKEKSEIQDYEILQSRDAVKFHNRYIKQGKKVFTFIHTVG